MGRLYQDYEFIVDAVAGLRLKRLIAVSDADSDSSHPFIFYAKFFGATGWHRFFLDISAAFWDRATDDDVAEDFQDDSYKCESILEDRSGAVVTSAVAYVPDGEECAGIDIVFDDGRSFIIRCIHDGDDHYTEAKWNG
ncbi:MAG: hypothetical protein AAGD07_23245 [Planctomycetota bacterium]